MADKITFRFLNKDTREYVQTTSPISYTKDISSALSLNVEVDKLDYDWIKNNICNTVEDILMHDTVNNLHIYFFDEFDKDFGYLECLNLQGSVKLMSCSSIGASELSSMSNDVQQAFIYIGSVFSGELLDIVLRARSSTSVATASKIASSGVTVAGSPSLSSSTSSTDIDKLCERIRKETKADVVRPKETLDDYICNNLLKEELIEIRDFFKNAKLYRDAGVEIPKGILFKGPPGTGKTYAARCIAGSTDCFFMVCTASSLQGMYIGSGAENIRNVFKGAKLLATESGKGVMIFIDEIDSLGSRENHGGGAGGEEDRTLNQLLAEMSGFENDNDIMVLAATNYVDRLDDALQRSGRFGRQITIKYPDEEQREHLIEHYFSKIKLPLLPSITDIVPLTKSFTPADIKEMVNESSILTIRHGESNISIDNINESINKVITKNIRNPDSPDAKQLHLVTAHECGHVLAGVLYEKAVPVKVTNYSYGGMGGFTQQGSSLEDKIFSQEELLNKVYSLLGGRAAEQVIEGFITCGASSDLEKAKSLLKTYYTVYNFEPYEVKDIEQVVLNKLNSIYKDLVERFELTLNRKILDALIAELCSKRTLYASDIAPIVAPILGGFKI